jgi:heptosyltransferase III
LKIPETILVIIQRSNGDVFFSSSLVAALQDHYPLSKIDLLVNDDTIPIAKLIPYINKIHYFSYAKKKTSRWLQEKKIISKIFKKYDLSINLTASDRSVIYSLLAGKISISPVEKSLKKSWWKKLLLNHFYFFDKKNHILINNLKPLRFLNIKSQNIHKPIVVSEIITNIVKTKLRSKKIKDFVIFHPSSQYEYKNYPQHLRNDLLNYLNDLGVSILITGGNSLIDNTIKQQIPLLPNIVDFIGETSIEEFIALSDLSLGYIGMDTLNMHIAASQNKRIFAIFGPTNLKMWSPWSNQLQSCAIQDKPIQNYGNVTIFQADMPCVACGKAGCNDSHGDSICLYKIEPKIIFNEIKHWYLNMDKKGVIPVALDNLNSHRKILLYIVYGEDQTYYDGALFSFLTFKHWLSLEDNIEFVVLTEKPEKFIGYPISTLLMTDRQKKEWSINGSYHFRIKNRGLAYVMDELNLIENDKILFLDTDTYFHKSPLKLFDLINFKQAVFYLNEGLIYERKRFYTYIENLEGIKIDINGDTYQLSKNSAMWGSLMVGIMPNMRRSLDLADKLMLKLFELVPAHTIEPFSLSELLLKKYSIVEGKKFVSLYSTSRKKEYASKVLSKFFNHNQSQPFYKQVLLAQKIKIKRPILVVLKQRLQRLIKF